eukprot:TRINITY_DN3222_c5_g1_i1.p1 TRINITY_DN3222_c5_g1~~TRINITY_DN3222_c5_g1_i1.p1  ORF type:complete len:1586 (+),score=509.76 TRINITY_DN3222_c5_g1_i1:58-4815(+)
MNPATGGGADAANKMYDVRDARTASHNVVQKHDVVQLRPGAKDVGDMISGDMLGEVTDVAGQEDEGRNFELADGTARVCWTSTTSGRREDSRWGVHQVRDLQVLDRRHYRLLPVALYNAADRDRAEFCLTDPLEPVEPAQLPAALTSNATEIEQGLIADVDVELDILHLDTGVTATVHHTQVTGVHAFRSSVATVAVNPKNEGDDLALCGLRNVFCDVMVMFADNAIVVLPNVSVHDVVNELAEYDSDLDPDLPCYYEERRDCFFYPGQELRTPRLYKKHKNRYIVGSWRRAHTTGKVVRVVPFALSLRVLAISEADTIPLVKSAMRAEAAAEKEAARGAAATRGGPPGSTPPAPGGPQPAPRAVPAAHAGGYSAADSDGGAWHDEDEEGEEDYEEEYEEEESFEDLDGDDGVSMYSQMEEGGLLLGAHPSRVSPLTCVRYEEPPRFGDVGLIDEALVDKLRDISAAGPTDEKPRLVQVLDEPIAPSRSFPSQSGSGLQFGMDAIDRHLFDRRYAQRRFDDYKLALRHLRQKISWDRKRSVLVVGTRMKVKVRWLDGTTSGWMDPRLLYNLRHTQDFDFFPGEMVALGSEFMRDDIHAHPEKRADAEVSCYDLQAVEDCGVGVGDLVLHCPRNPATLLRSRTGTERWTCPKCTLSNITIRCAACTAFKPLNLLSKHPEEDDDDDDDDAAGNAAAPRTLSTLHLVGCPGVVIVSPPSPVWRPYLLCQLQLADPATAPATVRGFAAEVEQLRADLSSDTDIAVRVVHSSSAASEDLTAALDVLPSWVVKLAPESGGDDAAEPFVNVAAAVSAAVASDSSAAADEGSSAAPDGAAGQAAPAEGADARAAFNSNDNHVVLKLAAARKSLMIVLNDVQWAVRHVAASLKELLQVERSRPKSTYIGMIKNVEAGERVATVDWVFFDPENTPQSVLPQDPFKELAATAELVPQFTTILNNQDGGTADADGTAEHGQKLEDSQAKFQATIDKATATAAQAPPAYGGPGDIEPDHVHSEHPDGIGRATFFTTARTVQAGVVQEMIGDGTIRVRWHRHGNKGRPSTAQDDEVVPLTDVVFVDYSDGDDLPLGPEDGFGPADDAAGGAAAAPEAVPSVLSACKSVLNELFACIDRSEVPFDSSRALKILQHANEDVAAKLWSVLEDARRIFARPEPDTSDAATGKQEEKQKEEEEEEREARVLRALPMMKKAWNILCQVPEGMPSEGADAPPGDAAPAEEGQPGDAPAATAGEAPPLAAPRAEVEAEAEVEADADEESLEEDPTERFVVIEAFEDHQYLKSASGVTLNMKRIQKEWKAFHKNLPPGIKVVASETQPQLLQAVIEGPSHTPYRNALYAFQMYLPDQFPFTPPKAKIVSNNLRLNPNLYANGYICLSLLGTWDSHQTCEEWSDKSTLLQVFVSIQGLVLTKEPYYNEPGYHNHLGTEEGRQNSVAYNEQVYLLTLRYLTALLRNEPLHLKDEIRAFVKRNWEGTLRRAEKYIAAARRKADRAPPPPPPAAPPAASSSSAPDDQDAPKSDKRLVTEAELCEKGNSSILNEDGLVEPVSYGFSVSLKTSVLPQLKQVLEERGFMPKGWAA